MWLKLPDLAAFVADPGPLDPSELLETWRFLVPPQYEPVLITTLGDLFMVSPDGRVALLDVGAGTLRYVASSMDEFLVVLYDPDTFNEFFLPDLVASLQSAGVPLRQGQCYHAITPPNLGGQYQPSNYTPLDIVAHFRGMGQVQSQLSGLPPGTHVVVR